MPVVTPVEAEEMLSIRGISDWSSNPALSRLRMRPPSAASLRAENFVKQLDAAIHDALSGMSSDPSIDPRVGTSAIEQEFQAALHDRGFDSEISHTGKFQHHPDGPRRHATGGAAGAASSAAPDFSAQLGMGGVGRVSARDVSRSSRTIHRAPDLQSLLHQLSQVPQQFRNDLFLALLRSQHGPLNQNQAVQSIETGENVNVLA